MWKICVVCKADFESYNHPRKGHGTRVRQKRPVNAITCSSKCSKQYDRHERWKK